MDLIFLSKNVLISFHDVYPYQLAGTTSTFKHRGITLSFLIKLINDLISGGIIEPVSWPTAWCSPAHFVPKAGTKDVRLVTDFTKLNRYVRRPVHPFQSGAEILRQIKPSS